MKSCPRYYHYCWKSHSRYLTIGRTFVTCATHCTLTACGRTFTTCATCCTFTAFGRAFAWSARFSGTTAPASIFQRVASSCVDCCWIIDQCLNGSLVCILLQRPISFCFIGDIDSLTRIPQRNFKSAVWIKRNWDLVNISGISYAWTLHHSCRGADQCLMGSKSINESPIFNWNLIRIIRIDINTPINRSFGFLCA